MEIRIFNVHYVHHHRFTRESTDSSVVLINKHPLIWASEPPDKYRINHFNTIKSWTEVAEKDVPGVLDVLLKQNILNVEDYRTPQA